MKSKNLSLLAAAVIGSWSFLQGNAQTMDGLKTIVDQANAACPVTINTGVVQQSVALNDSAIVYQVAVDPAQAKIQDLESNKQLMHDGKAMELATDSSANALAPYCQRLNISVIYHFSDGTTSFDVIILPKEMTF